MIITTAASLAAGNTSCEHVKTPEKSKELAEVLSDSTNQTENEQNTAEFTIYKPADSEKTKDIEKKKEECFTINTSELEGGPLFGTKRMIAPSYGNLLGFSQAETIMNDYNGNENKPFDANNRLSKNETINIPLIYPELKPYFPENRSELAEKLPGYKTVKDNNLTIITQLDNGKNALAYYKDGKLKLATYVSIGKKRTKTPEGKYTLKRDIVRRRSRKYHNSAMPNSMHIVGAGTGGVFTHQGPSDGFPKSHGCGRLPGLYQHYLYYELPEESTIVLVGLYEPTLTRN